MCEVMIPQRLCKQVYEKLCKANGPSFEAHQQGDKAYAEVVAKCSDLLSSSCGYTNLLGMESFSCITDPTVTDKTICTILPWNKSLLESNPKQPSFRGGARRADGLMACLA